MTGGPKGPAAAAARAAAVHPRREKGRIIERFICLSVPLTIWMTAASFAVGMVLRLGLKLDDAAYASASWVVNPLLWIGYFGAMRRLITETAWIPPVPTTR